MRFLSTLRLLVAPGGQQGQAGAVYFDSVSAEPLYHDGSSWNLFGRIGFPDPIVTSLVVPDGRQVTYFDHFTNDGILAITGTGVLVGMR